MQWTKQFGKVGFFTGLTTIVLIIFGVRTLLGVELGWKNYLAFVIFGTIVGFLMTLILFYRWHIAFYIFFISLILGFVEMFRNFLFSSAEHANSLGILGLYSVTAIGCGLGIIIQLITILIKKQPS